MHRAKSAVWNECARNKTNGRYVVAKANHKAYARRHAARHQGKKIVRNPALRKEVDWRLLDGQSPKAIAGWLRRNRKSKKDRASKNAIYRYLASPYGRKIEAALWLKRKKHRLRKRRGSKKKLSDRIFIDERPHFINDRRRIGDVEADFILSGRSGKGILLTVVDRKSRISFIERITEVTIPNVHRAFVRIQKRFPELASITTDNDVLFAWHKELEQLLGVKIYFCHPYHSWEKGSIEKTNGVIRKDIPKGSGISRYSKRHLARLEAKLNRRPMEVIGFRTPREMLDAYRMRKKKMKKQKNA